MSEKNKFPPNRLNRKPITPLKDGPIEVQCNWPEKTVAKLKAGQALFLRVISEHDKMYLAKSSDPSESPFTLQAYTHDGKKHLGNIELEVDTLNYLSFRIQIATAFVKQLNPLVLLLDLVPDPKIVVVRPIWFYEQRGKFKVDGYKRLKTLRGYMNAYPERFPGHTPPAKHVRTIDPEEKALKEQWGFRRNEPGCVFYKGKDVIVHVPEKIGKQTVTGLASDAFASYDEDGNISGYSKNIRHRREILEEVICPKTLKSIEYSAFCGTHALKKITLPATIEHVNKGAFIYSAIEEITIRGKKCDWDSAVAVLNDVITDKDTYGHISLVFEED
jgi:hypothetical protein